MGARVEGCRRARGLDVEERTTPLARGWNETRVFSCDVSYKVSR